MNDTIQTFGYPKTLIAEYSNWVVLLRPSQVTLGSLVLACKQSVTSFSAMDEHAFAELRAVSTDIETTLAKLFSYEKINYLMLMMVDPHVHYHVLPRYSEPQTFGDHSFLDHGWPGPPTLGNGNAIDANITEQLLKTLKSAWPTSLS